MPQYGPNTQFAASVLGDVGPGVIVGLTVRDPQSSTLATTVQGGWIRLLPDPSQPGPQRKFTEYNVQDTAKTFTASKDTYVYISSTGTLGYIEVANGAAKPTQATLNTTGGVGAQFIAKVVTNGSRVVDGGVTDLRQMSGADLLKNVVALSFESGEQGSHYFEAPCDIRVLRVQGTVLKAVAATDNGTIQLAVGLNDKYTNVANNGLITFTASAAIGTRASVHPGNSTTGPTIVRGGQVLLLTTAKTTAGGKINTEITYERVG